LVPQIYYQSVFSTYQYPQEGRPAHAHHFAVPVPEGKHARRELETQLPAALAFMAPHVRAGRRVLVHCNQGMDRYAELHRLSDMFITIQLFDLRC
jgi:hypothetical protein